MKHVALALAAIAIVGLTASQSPAFAQDSNRQSGSGAGQSEPGSTGCQDRRGDGVGQRSNPSDVGSRRGSTRAGDRRTKVDVGTRTTRTESQRGGRTRVGVRVGGDE